MSRVWLNEEELRNQQILRDNLKRNMKIILDFIRHHQPTHPPTKE